ncbi:MAG: type IV secretory system conjugative DNA transfer family protein, partial [Candidatus Paceibacterota bacterium]
DPVVKAFWTQEFAGYTERFAAEATPAIQNKIGQFTSSALVRNIVGQPKSTIDMRRAMDEGKILLVNISKGRIGEEASRLLGALIITKIQLAAMSRVDIPEQERRDFILTVDEFQNFATASFANILSEARKYHLSLIVAHQYVAQMDEGVRDAVFGNVGTIISFRVGAEDAELLEKELAPEFMATDIVNLGKRQIYLKLMIDGVASRAFSAMTMERFEPLAVSNRQRVIESSRKLYAATRSEVEGAIAKWHEPLDGEEGQKEDSRPVSRDSRPPRKNKPAPRPPIRSDSRPPSREPARPVSLSEALKQGPVDFKGRKFQPKPPVSKPKVKVDLQGLRDALKGSISNGDENTEETN